MELSLEQEIINSQNFTRDDGGYSTIPTDYFWFLWKKYKEDIKAAGFYCTKDEDLDIFILHCPVDLYEKNLLDLSRTIETPDYPPITRSTFLKPYQVPHTQALIAAFATGNILDGSDTGIGKTYCAIATAMEYQLPIFVVTPKSVINQWKKAVRLTGIECKGILNYEALKFGRSKFLSKENDAYIWHLPSNVVIIWDEAHRCKSDKTANSKMLMASIAQGFPAMALSATIAERPDHFSTIGPMLGLFKAESYYTWMLKHGMYFKKFGEGRAILDFSGSKYHLWKIHTAIYPECGHRVTKRELGDLFPENLITAEACEMDNATKISKVFEKMKKELRELEKKKAGDLNQEHPLTIRLRARQEVELLKVPTFIELAEDALDEGNSVIIFVNFVETLVSLQNHFKTDSVVRGGQKPDERQKVLDDFQTNQTRLIILVIQAGSVGIDLHDVDGNYPRLSLISPTDRSVDLHQAFGRPHRSGGMSPVIQKIIFAAGTVEEKVCENVDNKLSQMEMINDGDLFLE